jgi:hypothetical protein
MNFVGSSRPQESLQMPEALAILGTDARRVDDPLPPCFSRGHWHRLGASIAPTGSSRRRQRSRHVLPGLGRIVVSHFAIPGASPVPRLRRG